MIRKQLTKRYRIAIWHAWEKIYIPIVIYYGWFGDIPGEKEMRYLSIGLIAWEIVFIKEYLR